jgi:small subunit ribosomal protein S18
MADFMERLMSDRRPPTHPVVIDYKDLETLAKLVNAQGQIFSRKRTGCNTRRQKAIKKALKRARHLALMPFVS